MEIVLLVVLAFFLLKSLFSDKKTSSGETEKNIRKNEQIGYQAVEKIPNPNQEQLIQTVFSLAEKGGGMWRVSFTSEGISIYKKNGERDYVPLSRLGFGELDLNKNITYQSRFYNEFPYRLKKAAESRGYLYWTEKGHGVVQGSTYTSYDNGHSYTREDSAGSFIKSANVCSKEYYRTYKPYQDPNLPPLKKL